MVDKTGFEYDESKFRKEMLGFLQYDVDFKPAFKVIAQQFRKSRKSIFRLKGPGEYPDFKGKKGRDGRTAYQRRKIREKGGKTVNQEGYPLLVWSGNLRDSVIKKNHPDAITEISSKTLVIGSKNEVLPFHDSPKPRSVMPYRKVFFWGPEQKTFKDLGLPRGVKDTIRQHVARQLGLSPNQARTWVPDIKWK